MPQNKQTTNRDFVGYLLALLFLCVLIFGLYQIKRIVDTGKDEYAELRQTAETAAAMMHYDDLLKLSAVPEDTVKQEYATIKNLLANIKRVNTTAKFSYIYTIRDGKVLFIADSEPMNSPECSPAGQVYGEATELDKTLMDEGSKPVIEFSKDRWGDWVSVLIQLKHPVTRKNIAVFGMDFDAKVWKEKRHRDLAMSLLIVILSLMAMGALYRIIKINHKLKRDYELLKKAEADLLLAKERAEESDRLKTAFLKNISHEIRTPMNSIMGFAEILKQQDLTAEYKEMFLTNMAKSGQRMLNTIFDIIELSRIQSGQVRPIYSRTNMQDQFDMVQEVFYPVAKEKKLTCVCELATEYVDLVFYTDTEMLKSILQKLLWNAFKFTAEGFVQVGAVLQGDMLLFSVKDTGVGVDEQQHAFIFEYFRQGNETLTRKYEGAGTGLAIAKAHVELLGGTIWVESEPGVGSTFYFTIPYHPHAPLITD